jgi:FkbM family methyltransferase
MRQPKTIFRDVIRHAGFDVCRWPQRPDDLVLNWSLSAVLRAHDVNCVLDVGANNGQFGQLIRSLGYTGRIVSFEPSPTALPALRAVAARDDKWKIRPVGLAAKPGQAELHLHPASVFNSLHAALPDDELPEADWELAQLFRRSGDTDSVTVQLSTLALEYPEAVAGLPKARVLLKTDTQGHDLEVITGGEGVLSQVAAVLVELSALAIYKDQPRMTRVIDILQDAGFAAVAFQPVTRLADNLRAIEFDGLFMRATAAAS